MSAIFGKKLHYTKSYWPVSKFEASVSNSNNLW